MKKVVAGLFVAGALTIGAGSVLAGGASSAQERATFVQAQGGTPETPAQERSGDCDRTQEANLSSNTL